MRLVDSEQFRPRSRSRRGRLMILSSSISRSGRCSERWFWSHRREKSSLAVFTSVRQQRSLQRKTKARTSSCPRSCSTPKRSFWNFIFTQACPWRAAVYSFIHWNRRFFLVTAARAHTVQVVSICFMCVKCRKGKPQVMLHQKSQF